MEDGLLMRIHINPVGCVGVLDNGTEKRDVAHLLEAFEKENKIK